VSRSVYDPYDPEDKPDPMSVGCACILAFIVVFVFTYRMLGDH